MEYGRDMLLRVSEKKEGMNFCVLKIQFGGSIYSCEELSLTGTTIRELVPEELQLFL